MLDTSDKRYQVLVEELRECIISENLEISRAEHNLFNYRNHTHINFDGALIPVEITLHTLDVFDMDDVLIQPGAYNRALQETVRLVGGALGFGEVRLDEAEIRAFESAGVYSEWDSSAICTALLLEAAWELDPGIQLPERLGGEPAAQLPVAPPDFRRFAAELMHPELRELRPLVRAERLLLEHDSRFSEQQYAQIRRILHTARGADGS